MCASGKSKSIASVLPLRIFKIFAFISRYFSQGEGTRKERRMIIHQKREMDKQEALKRGKMLDEHGNVMKKY